MKRILFFGVGFFLLQSTFAQNIEFGIKGGFNFSHFKDDKYNNDAKTGFHIGGLAHIHLTDKFAVQPEVMYSAQGADYGAKWKANYVNIPVLAQYMFANGFRLQTGPQLGILVGSEVKTPNSEIEVDDAFKSIDFSWSFGAGYLTHSGLGIDARYNLGLSNVNNNTDRDVMNRVWQFGLFYQFKH